MTVRVSKPAFNIRDALNSLRRKIGIKGGELMAAETAADAYAVLNPVMYRNKLINGGFDVWQRGTSISAASNITGYQTADRWFHQNSATFNVGSSRQSFAVGQTDVPGNPTYYFRYTLGANSSAGDYGILEQRVEDVTWGSGGNVTLSFYAKSSVNGNKVNIEFNQYCGPGSSGRYTNVASKAITLSNAWKYYTVTLAIPSVSGRTITSGNYLEMYLWCSGGSTYASRNGGIGNQSGDFDFACVQLERGAVATPFEFRPYGVELALCQRYFYRSNPSNIDGCGEFNGSCFGSNVSGNFIKWPVTMRTSPTVTRGGSQDTFWVPGSSTRYGTASWQNNYASPTGYFAEMTSLSNAGIATGMPSIYNGQISANAEL